ncbi:MAG TPA: CusA/CzcA family heavy metal efflux RND transporter [Vicinamibacterales bacterium]|jgi:cobalt-zinc-cadmium resistance protein CzcA
MKTIVHLLLRYRALVLLALAAWIALGVYAFLNLDIEAYPDPSPPLVEFITQNPSWSAEEMERQVTVPVETALFGIPGLQAVRSISIFGLSDVKLYFGYGTDYTADRQEALNRLQALSLPGGLTPQWSPWSPVGEIYRFRLDGQGYSLNALTAEADWDVRRELKQVPGIIDVTMFGGTTRQYQADIDPAKLLAYHVALPQVLSAVAAGNANAGGNYLSLGDQSVNVRGIGLLASLDDMRHVLVSEQHGVPIFLRDLADVHEGVQPRLGRIGMDRDDDIVEGIVLLQRGEQSLPALERLRQKIAALNGGLLPPGMKIRPIYDRTDLINVTTHTIRDIVALGLVLVAVLLLLFLGDLRISLIATLSIPVALLFAFICMRLTHQSANLISVGAIDFGILVDVTVINLEHIHRRLRARTDPETVEEAIATAMAETTRPVVFSVAVILVAFIPLFTMTGVPGQIFAPMSITYGYALLGGQLFAIAFAPVLASYGAETARARGAGETVLVRWLHRGYGAVLPIVLRRRGTVLAAAVAVLVLGLLLVPSLGSEFMPRLEEGNLWVRATLPVDASFESAGQIADRMRGILGSFPVVTHVVSQEGRPDDGTDVTTFNNLEFFVQLKPEAAWPAGLTKAALVQHMTDRLSAIPGVSLGFSQNIEDNVEEAMSGVKGENSLKLFGPDIDVLAERARAIRDVMAGVRGIADLGVFQETGQPELLIAIDRQASARYGLAAGDVNAAVQAAIGGQAATQIIDGDRRFDFVVRYQAPYRATPTAIRHILLRGADGDDVPLGQVASISIKSGAFTVYRENGERYIPIKFSVRGRDLASTIEEMQRRIAAHVKLPTGYHYELAGEYDSLRKEERRLSVIVPVTLALIVVLLFTLFNSWIDALIVLSVLPFGIIGGILALRLTGTPFSISAAVGFTSAIGVGTLAASVFLSGLLRHEGGGLPEETAADEDRRRVIVGRSLGEMRAILLACLAASLGLLPAAMSTAIGSQAQQPLACVVVGAMLAMIPAILLLMPVAVSVRRR